MVAGGRSSRLGGEPKALLRSAAPAEGTGLTLVESAVAQLAAAGIEPARIVVVGPEDLPVAPPVLRAREDPPFSGPAAALAAGAEALEAAGAQDGWTLTLACDMPRTGGAVAALLEAVRELDGQQVRGAVLVDRGILQPLAAAYPAAVLVQQLRSQPVVDRSVRGVLGPLWERQRMVEGLTDDVDTWDDVQRFGLRPDRRSD